VLCKEHVVGPIRVERRIEVHEIHRPGRHMLTEDIKVVAVVQPVRHSPPLSSSPIRIRCVLTRRGPCPPAVDALPHRLPKRRGGAASGLARVQARRAAPGRADGAPSPSHQPGQRWPTTCSTPIGWTRTGASRANQVAGLPNSLDQLAAVQHHGYCDQGHDEGQPSPGVTDRRLSAAHARARAPVPYGENAQCANAGYG